MPMCAATQVGTSDIEIFLSRQLHGKLTRSQLPRFSFIERDLTSHQPLYPAFKLLHNEDQEQRGLRAGNE